MDKLEADSFGKTAPCLQLPLRFTPVWGPPPPGLAAAVRGLAPQGGSDRSSLGSHQRIRLQAWSARPPFSLPRSGWMLGFKNRIIARIEEEGLLRPACAAPEGAGCHALIGVVC